METVVSCAPLAAGTVLFLSFFAKKTAFVNFSLDGIFREKQSLRIESSIASLLASYSLLAGLPPFTGPFALVLLCFVNSRALREPENAHGILNESRCYELTKEEVRC